MFLLVFVLFFFVSFTLLGAKLLLEGFSFFRQHSRYFLLLPQGHVILPRLLQFSDNPLLLFLHFFAISELDSSSVVAVWTLSVVFKLSPIETSSVGDWLVVA